MVSRLRVSLKTLGQSFPRRSSAHARKQAGGGRSDLLFGPSIPGSGLPRVVFNSCDSENVCFQ